MVNVGEQYNLPAQRQNKAGSAHITVILWCGCVTVVDV